MYVFDYLAGILWLGWIAFWFISARGVKKDVSGSDWRRFWWARVAFFLSVIVIAFILKSFGIRPSVAPAAPLGQPGAYLGLLAIVVGIGFSIWARIHLGSNWSNRPALKEGHELVTSGPYSFVRHPIYTGIILAMLGTALLVGWLWLVFFVIAIGVYVARIPVEERIMEKQFPDQYPEYKKRTKALIPLVW